MPGLAFLGLSLQEGAVKLWGFGDPGAAPAPRRCPRAPAAGRGRSRPCRPAPPVAAAPAFPGRVFLGVSAVRVFLLHRAGFRAQGAAYRGVNADLSGWQLYLVLLGQFH